DDATEARARRQAADAETRRLVDDTERRQEKVRQLMDRFDSLMDEHRYDLAELQAAAEVNKLAPDTPIAMSATTNSQMQGWLYNLDRIKLERQRQFLNTLYTCEVSSIPFPDDQPIVYPDASVWQDLTYRRKKYKQADLKTSGGAEKKINEELQKDTN